jgi:5-methylcytosine-specific restriction endonuclease McrA
MGRQRSRNGWKDRKRFLENYIAVNGHVCPGLDGVPHRVVRLEVDHIVPVALGGRDLGNLRVLCSRCNRSRGARLGNDLRRAKNLAPARHSRDW